MGKRKGVVFEMGNPYVESELQYFWPRVDNDLSGLKKEGLREFLFERFKEHLDEWQVNAMLPNFEKKGEKFVAVLHFGEKGEWIEVGKMLGNAFIGTHNLEGYREKIIAFNLGSDTLEFVEEGILAPRISIGEGRSVIKYPLPEGFSRLPVEREELNDFFHNGLLEKEVSIARLGEIKKKSLDGEIQRIEMGEGVIEITEGLVTGRNFEGYDICKATFPIAKLVDSCSVGL